MKKTNISDKLYNLYDRFCDRVEKISFRRFNRIFVPVLFVFFALAGILYCIGAYDFVFITRPDTHVIEEVTEGADEDKVDGTDTSDTSAKGGNGGEGNTEPVVIPDNSKESISMESSVEIRPMTELCAEGYVVTDKVYNAENYRIGVLNVDLGAAKEYSVNTRQVYVPEYYNEISYGELKVRYVLGEEPRPSLEAYMGKLYADTGDRIWVLDAYGGYYGTFNDSYFFAYTRDSEGNPLYYLPATYRVLSGDGEYYGEVDTKLYYTMSYGGQMWESDYVDEIENRGLHMDYPAWYATETEGIERKCIANTVSYWTLKNELTGWLRTVWGYFKDGSDESIISGWYDVEEENKKEPVDKTDWEDWQYDEYEDSIRELEHTRIYHAYNFSEGYGCVANEEGQMWFVDTDGEQTFDCINLDNKYNASGRRICENLLLPLTDGIESLGFYYFDHGLCRVRRQTYDYYQLWDYDVKRTEYDDDELIYANGEKFTVAEGYDIQAYSDGMVLLERDGKYGYMDYTGAWAIKPQLEGAKPYIEGLAAVKQNGKWGMIDTAGNTVIPFKYDNIQNVSSGLIVCHSDIGWTVFTVMSK